MLYQYAFTMTTRHIVAVSDTCDLDDVGVLYITNSLRFGQGQRVPGSEDVRFDVRVLRESDSVDAVESEWPESEDLLEMTVDECDCGDECVRFVLLEQDASFAFDVEAGEGLSVEALENGMDWDLQFETDSDGCCLLGSATLEASEGTLRSAR